MKFDYSPAEPVKRPSAQRSAFAAVLCVIAVVALVSQNVTAKRQPTLNAADSGEAELVSVVADDGATVLGDSGAAADELLQSEVADALAAPTASDWISVTVARGQSFSTLIEGLGMPKGDWVEAVSLTKDAKRLKNLRAGEKIHIRKNAEGRLEELSFDLDEERTLQIRRGDAGLEAITLAAEMERRVAEASGVIRTSLFAAGQEVGLSDRIIIEMAEIFGYDIDFGLDLREGDRFSVIYEEIYKNGEKLRDGALLVAEFVNQNTPHRAIRYTASDGRSAYYTPDGQSLRKAFLRSPVDFARISSGFNLRRKHPILNTIRAHKGVDYAAATGTPIRATGDGKVSFIGYKGGYGRVVILKHGTKYETLYAHLSRYRNGLKAGATIRQGQIIGYVGSSGLATAPHLHYEFRVNGIHKNPITVALPRANSLSSSQLAQWQNQSGHLIAKLDRLSQAQVAQQQPALTQSSLAR